MLGLSGFKLYGALGGAAVVAFMTWATLDRFSLADKLGDLRGDVAACERATVDLNLPLDRCSPGVKVGLESTRRAARCDQALAEPPAVGAFSIRLLCSQPVKRVLAERDAAAASSASLRAALDAARTTQTEAVARAEARGAAQSTRRDRSDAAIQAAPGAGGSGSDRRSCDAECLRDLG